jgi:hypothetical protein
VGLVPFAEQRRPAWEDGNSCGQRENSGFAALSGFLHWPAIVATLLLFLCYLGWLHPERYFGRYHDDAIYFSSAKALAEGQGYVVPSLPGPDGKAPPQTKYPILFSWLLSWVWKWQPAFPANLRVAVGLSSAFACWFLVVSFLLLHKMRGLGNWGALAIMALCAFHPHFLFLSGAVLSDVLFMALAMTAALSADAAMRSHAHALPAALAAVMSGLSLLTRRFGWAVLAGIMAAFIYRRRWRAAAAFCVASAPFVAAAIWPHPHAELLVASDAEAGWRQTWLYYTSYGGFWKFGVPKAGVLLAMLGVNLRAFLLAPSSFCLFPPLGDDSYLGTLLNFALSGVS